MKAWVTAMAFSLLSAVPAFAEWGLYVNRDGKSWTLQEKTYESSSACDRAAQSLWAGRGLYGSVHGVTCSVLAQLTETQKAAVAAREAAKAAERARQVEEEQKAQERVRRAEQRMKEETEAWEQKRRNTPTEWRIDPGTGGVPPKIREAEARLAARAQRVAEAEERSRRAQAERDRELARQAANPKGLEPFRLQVDCKKEVLARLLSPGTAQFPEGFHVDGTRVRAEVDSHNGMGALIRGSAVCEFTKHGYFRDVSITTRAPAKDSPLKKLEDVLELKKVEEVLEKGRE